MMKTLCLTIVFCCFAVFAAEQPDAIIEKNTRARGGAEALQKVESIRIRGVVTGQGMELPFVYVVSKDKVRFEYHSEAMPAIRIFDGQRGWTIQADMPDMPPQRLNDQESGFLRDLCEIEGPLVRWREKGHEVRFESYENLGGHETVKLFVRTFYGTEKNVYLDAESGLCRRIETLKAGKITGVVSEIEHATVQSVVFLKSFTRATTNCCPQNHESDNACQGSWKVTFTEYELNPDIDENIFIAEAGLSLLAMD